MSRSKSISGGRDAPEGILGPVVGEPIGARPTPERGRLPRGLDLSNPSVYQHAHKLL